MSRLHARPPADDGKKVFSHFRQRTLPVIRDAVCTTTMQAGVPTTQHQQHVRHGLGVRLPELQLPQRLRPVGPPETRKDFSRAGVDPCHGPKVLHDLQGVCVSACVRVFFVSVVRANRLTNEKTSACSREKVHKRTPKCLDPFGTVCVCVCVCVWQYCQVPTRPASTDRVLRAVNAGTRLPRSKERLYVEVLFFKMWTSTRCPISFSSRVSRVPRV